MSDETSLRLADELRLRRALAVIEHHVKTGEPINASCDVCNVKTSTFYDWVSAGVLDTYLDDCRRSRSETAATMAAEAIPDITAYLVRVATGQVRVRGANPIAAAQLILSLAGVTPGREKSAAGMPLTTNVLQFIPQLVQFNIVQGMPARNADGTLDYELDDTIDGEAVEIPPDGENPPAPAE
jgi:hypothetical protein